MPTASHIWRRRVIDDQPSLRPETRIRRQADGVEKLLGLKYRARVLDLGCGSGHQTLELARRKYRVMGLDISPKSLAQARTQARDEDLTVHFLAQDMRRLPYDQEFNAVINIRNPIGCYPREKDDAQCMDTAARALKIGGRLLLDLLNREWVLRRLTTNTRSVKGPSFDISTGRLDCSGFKTRGNRSDSMGETMRLYSLTEAMSMVRNAGLIFRHVYGAYDGSPYGVDSLRMIVVAEKAKTPIVKRRSESDEFERALRIKGRPR